MKINAKTIAILICIILIIKTMASITEHTKSGVTQERTTKDLKNKSYPEENSKELCIAAIRSMVNIGDLLAKISAC